VNCTLSRPQTHDRTCSVWTLSWNSLSLPDTMQWWQWWTQCWNRHTSFRHTQRWCHDLAKTAKSLSIFLFFLFFFFLSWTYYTEGSVMSQVSHSHNHMTGSHSVTSHESHDESHDRHGKIVHRPCSSCISSMENLTRTLSSSLCQSLNKEQLALFQLGV